ncbi:phosphoribosylformylglycinamidine synthase [candidate division LCP-89 bacterium B3_LCP]|uniref:Phosphoribosylformylglycinamidine synthase subunit PurS n=1 Tax=candidate division LCP-89 bacterium B3_LCP TaxID=2012998 RepID=A0A532UZ70_UNCL8|nr:MAG: phosphoribosylformylglycinamidine synthase [candidate division LCP-89 bacterium B3_LCP]
MTANVYITPKQDILDPQGKAVGNALRDLGYNEVTDVRVGRYIILKIDSVDDQDPRQRLEEMCKRLLANINVESYKIEIMED